jgi:hypothetical protein
MTVGSRLNRLLWGARAVALGAFILSSLMLASRANAGDPEPVQQLLMKTHGVVEQFVDQFSVLRYEEDVAQQKLKGKESDKVAYQQETVFDSIVHMRFEDGKLRVEEQRLMEKRPVHVQSRPLLSTYGFSTMEMIFHPYYESSFRFTELQDDTLQGKTLARVHFEHIPGTPSPLLYQMINQDRPVQVTGTAWIDPATGQIYRIEAESGSTLSDMGLQSIRVNVVYGPVLLQGETKSQWLPVSATIDLETPRQHWRNIHHFTDYRKYRVAVSIPGANPE